MVPSIAVTGRDDRVTSRQREHAAEKVSKLSRYNDRIVRLEVVLGYRGREAEAELLMHLPGGHPLVATSHAADLYAAVDLLVDKAERQLSRQKEKRKSHHRRSDSGRRQVVEPRTEDDEDQLQGYQEIVNQTSF